MIVSGCDTKECRMPEICRFLGIIVRMFAEPQAKHHIPHFHVYYQDFDAVFGIDPVALLAGELPGRQKRLVEGWAELHQDELMDDRRRLEQRIPPKAIAPLC